MKAVKQIDIRLCGSTDGFLAQAKNAGFGLGKLGEASAIIEEMAEEKAVVFLGLSGPLVPGGMRNVITELIKNGCVNAIVTSGANVVHDLILSFGGKHYALSENSSCAVSDAELYSKGFGRIGSVLIKNREFVKFEKEVQRILHSINEKTRENISIRELISEIGKRVKDRDSFIRAAYEKKVPIFSPAIIDSMLGLQLWFFSQENRLVLNAVKDMKELSDIVFSSKKAGAIILGGGVSKHYILGANLLRGGIDYGVQITLDREEGGSLSGAKLEEGISWGKVKRKSKLATITGDATLIFPLLAVKMLKGKGAR